MPPRIDLLFVAALSLRPTMRASHVAFLFGRQDHRHCLGVDRLDDCAGCGVLNVYLRGGHRFPSRVGVWGDLRLVVVRRTDRKVGFKCRQRAIFPFLSLAQERAALKGTEGRGLTVQRSYRAILAHIFQDDFLTHMHELTLPWLSPCSLRLWATTIFDFVSGLGKKPEWFPNP
jgi:hypothetical protein